MTVFKKEISKKSLGYLCCLIALLLCVCTEVKDHCGDYNSYDPNTQFCFAGAARHKCGGREYNPGTQECVGSTVRNRYTLTTGVSPAGSGTVTPWNQTNIISGESASISATAASGYEFVNWAVTSGSATFGSTTRSSTTVTINSNATITANFVRQSWIQTYTLTVNRDPAAGGTTTPASSQTNITSGTPVSISATAASGYTFNNWTVTSGSATFGTAISATTNVTLTSNATITANFTQLPQIQTYTLTVNRYPTAGGSTTPASSQTNIASETPVSISATAASGYEFVNWTLMSGLAAFGDANSAATTVTLSSNATITANFTPQQRTPTYTLTVNPAVGGTTTPASSQTNIASGTPVSISATAASGYEFVNWTVTSGSATTATFGNANSATTTVTLNFDATIRANFRQAGRIDGATLTYGGQNYRTVIIGGKRWMAENLNYETSSGSWCHGDDNFRCVIYGRLYDWATFMALPANCDNISCAPLVRDNHQGICPAGWRVPTRQDWNDLLRAAGGQDVAGGQLKSTSSWNSGNGADYYGFSALPGGLRSGNDSFTGSGGTITGNWWTATENRSTTAWFRSMNSDNAAVGEGSFDKRDGLSVRCVAVD